MSLLHLDRMTWTEVEQLDRSRAIAILPTGAVEAHGPHLPLGTDGIIAAAMAREGATRLAARGLLPVILPGLSYTAAPFAAAFPGTLTLDPGAVTATLMGIAQGLTEHGFRTLAIANAHLDPAHLGSLHAAGKACKEAGGIAYVFPDLTRKPWAPRLGEEFRSGACHAGRYETSVVMKEQPDLVRDAQRRELSENPSSLSDAIRRGQRTFHEAGGPRAYFGDPRSATEQEGAKTVRVLGEILDEAVRDAEAAGGDRGA